MDPLSFESITVDEIEVPILKEKNIRVAALRLDKIHPIISGNKWFKLKYYLEDAKESGKHNILTFGGAYSNHLVATAAAGRLFGFRTSGVVRGERHQQISHTQREAENLGMELYFIDRTAYRLKILPEQLQSQEFYKIDEGGYGVFGANGAAHILSYSIKGIYSHVACAVGTSTTMAGLIQACSDDQQIIGVSVLKNNHSLEQSLRQLLPESERNKNFEIHHNYHFGGYAKPNAQLISFMNHFYRNTAIPTDFVYTGKLFYAVFDLIDKDHFPGGSNILVIHSGGLQGNRSLSEGTLIF